VGDVLPFTKTLPELRNYEPLRFTEADSPTAVNFSIVYSSDASFAQATVCNCKLYVCQLIPLRKFFHPMTAPSFSGFGRIGRGGAHSALSVRIAPLPPRVGRGSLLASVLRLERY